MGVIAEFFIIIAGIVGAGANIFSGALKSSAQLREIEEKEHAKAEFTKKFIDPEAEKKILERVADFSQTDAIYEELESDLIEIFGDDYRGRCPIHPSCVRGHGIGGETMYIYWVSLLLLSKQGKFLSDRHVTLGPFYPEEIGLKVCKIVQRNIREFDPSFSLCFKCDITTTNYNVWSRFCRDVIPECDFNPPFKVNDISIYRL